MSGAGRPQGRNQATDARALLLARLADAGVVRSQLAVGAELSPSYLSEEIKRGREILASGTPSEAPDDVVDDSGDAVVVQTITKTKRPSARSVSNRATDLALNDPAFRIIDNDMIGAWIKAVALIAKFSTDGYGVAVGEGNFLRSKDHFARIINTTETMLDALCDYQMLLRLEDGGLGLPLNFGLTPRAIKIKVRVPAAPIPGQGAMLHSIRGGRSDNDEVPGNIQFHRTPVPCEIPDEQGFEGAAGGILPGTPDASRLAAAAAKVLNSTDIKQQQQPGASAAVPGEIPILPGTAEGILPGTVGPHPAAATVTDLLTVAGFNREPRAGELGLVQRWIETGVLSTARMVIQTRRAAGDKFSGLTYFTNPVMEAAAAADKAGPAQRDAAPQPAAALLSETERALLDRLTPIRAAWQSDPSTYPLPPRAGRFKDATPLDAELVDQWIEFWHAWTTAGRRAAIKPPDFSLFDSDRARFDLLMHDVAEALTAPDAAE
jgi:hypothetical protein